MKNADTTAVAVILSMHHHTDTDTLLQIVNYTGLCNSAVIIQARFRGYRSRKYFKHRFTHNWGQLLRLVDPEDLYTIEPYELVRQEWRNDADAWIFSMQQTDSEHTLQAIRQECADGRWGEKAVH